MRKLSTVLTSVLILLAVVLGRPALAADAVILESSVEALAIGAVIDDSAVVSIPAGRSVTVIMSDGETRVINGAYTGTFAAAAGAASSGVAAITGSRAADTRVLGAIRAPKWEVTQ